ncbi:MAG: bacteriohemerythrin [Sideroxydans sp.]|nr:bacteriohemerythrin [Sideroxydans sp.]
MTTRNTFFEWQDAYSVNIRHLDEQHKELVNMLNCLFIAAFERKANTTIVYILDALMNYCSKHFALEERLLEQLQHKDLDAHRHENRKLLEHLDLLHKKHLRDDLPVYFDMLYFLKHWMTDHFHGVDSEDLIKVGLSTAAWEKSANEEFPEMSASRSLCGKLKAA